MVTRKHTKSVKKRPPQQSAAPAQNPPLTTDQKAAKFDELMASYGAATKAGEAPAKRKPTLEQPPIITMCLELTNGLGQMAWSRVIDRR